MANRMITRDDLERESMETGISVETLIEKANDDAKKSYMTRVWAMTKDQIFHELMRVHGESSKLLMRAESEILYLKSLLDGPEDGDARH
jgi:hypothetical protein